jgi:uncharacterized oligopeptide transporter (OPT) family protein
MEENKNEKIDIKKILYKTSILVWVIYFGIAIFSIPFGFKLDFFSVSIIYGIKGFLVALIWNGIKFSILIPVLPLSLIYIIIYKSKIKLW